MRREHVEVAGVDQGGLVGAAEQVGGVVQEEGVEQVVLADQRGQGAPPWRPPGRPAATSRPRCPSSRRARPRPGRRRPCPAPGRWWWPARAAGPRTSGPAPGRAAPRPGSRPGRRGPVRPGGGRPRPPGGWRSWPPARPTRERVKHGVRTPASTAAASQVADSVLALRRRPVRRSSSGGSQRAKATRPREGSQSSMTASTAAGRPAGVASSAGLPRVAEASTKVGLAP